MIPAFGDSGHLRTAVESVLAQDSDGWRLVVVDDGPQDPDLAQRLGGLDPRVSYQHNPVTLGVNRNFQRCLDESSNDLVVLMGHDDRLLPDFVRTVATVAAHHPDVAWVQPGVRIIDETGRIVRPLADRVKGRIAPRVRGVEVLGGGDLATSLMVGDWMYFPSVAFRRETVVRYGFREGYGVVLDLDLLVRMLLDGHRAAFAEHVCFEYRRHRTSVSSSGAVAGDRFEEELRFYGWVQQEALAAGWRATARAAALHPTSRLHALNVAVAALVTGEVSRSGTLLRVALRRTPRIPRSRRDHDAQRPGREGSDQ
jgi:hypothetical protein